VAAPLYPGYSFAQQSVSMLDTHFSRHPWIFNAGEALTGLGALAGAVGLYQVFRTKTHFLLSCLIGFSVACIGIMAIKAGLFPMPDARHNSWGVLQNFIIITPFFLLMGLLERGSQFGLATLPSTLRYALVSSCSVGFLAWTGNSAAPHHRGVITSGWRGRLCVLARAADNSAGSSGFGKCLVKVFG
jgi:hypothetical membrane protein